jgi:exodeoxyribonuclease VII large subunit
MTSPEPFDLSGGAAATPRVFSVSELNRLVKTLIEEHYPAVWVEGEVSNLRIPASGHAYFTLKDSGGQIAAVMFRGDLARLRFRLQDGLHIVVSGELSVYEARGQYQVIGRDAFPRGVGALQAAFEQLKKKLQAEGLFAEERKRPIPMLPRRIGLVTSPTGAAIRDFLTVLKRRFPNLAILIDPVRVQGDQAAPEIVAAVDGFSARGDVDVVIVTRGGGSLEDLWPFNEESVARAIARSSLPVISAVGHEIDFTIADFVADLRVPTPSAAAELVIGHKDELSDRIRFARERMATTLRSRLQLLRNRLASAAGSYVFREPANAVRQYQQRIDELAYRLETNARRRLRDARANLDRDSASLAALSPLAVLERGYAIVFRAEDGRVVTDAGDVEPGRRVTARLHHGRIHAKVESTDEGEPSDDQDRT